MKSINDIPVNLKPVFEHLLASKWVVDQDYQPHTFALIHPVTRVNATILSFPEPCVGIISKSGTTLLGGGCTVTEIIESGYKI